MAVGPTTGQHTYQKPFTGPSCLMPQWRGNQRCHRPHKNSLKWSALCFLKVCCLMCCFRTFCVHWLVGMPVSFLCLISLKFKVFPRRTPAVFFVNKTDHGGFASPSSISSNTVTKGSEWGEWQHKGDARTWYYHPSWVIRSQVDSFKPVTLHLGFDLSPDLRLE